MLYDHIIKFDFTENDEKVAKKIFTQRCNNLLRIKLNLVNCLYSVFSFKKLENYFFSVVKKNLFSRCIRSFIVIYK